MAYADPNDPRNREAKRRHYQKNKETYLARAKAQKAEQRAFLNAVKSFPCLDCNVSYPPYVMHFDHRPEEEKLYEPATLANFGNWQKTVDEIMKCDVVCSNCHAERTHQRRNNPL
jgi:hypothetical protein